MTKTIDWRKMNKIQRLMVMSDFFDETFPADDCVDEINSFIQKRNEDTGGDYTENLKLLDADIAGQWRADLKKALRELDNITDWSGKKVTK